MRVLSMVVRICSISLVEVTVYKMDRTPWTGHWRCVPYNRMWIIPQWGKKKYNVVLSFMIAVNDFVSNEISNTTHMFNYLLFNSLFLCYCKPPNGLQMPIGIQIKSICVHVQVSLTSNQLLTIHKFQYIPNGLWEVQ